MKTKDKQVKPLNKKPIKGNTKPRISSTDAKKSGRPTDYNKKYNKQVEKLCKLGATDKQLSEFFEISESTLNLWKLKFPLFSESIKKGKQIADANVVESLYRRAIGFKHSDVDIKMYMGEIITTKTIKKYPPDTLAAIFWLKNRQRENWRDKQDVEHSGEIKEIKEVVYR